MYNSINPYGFIKTKVLKVIKETPSITTLKLKPEKPLSFKTGQFIELLLPGIGEAPFTPSSSPSVRDQFEVTVMRVGKVTEMIHKLKKNDFIGVRGPFGNGYPTDLFKGREITVIGGGCGFAPVRSLMYQLFDIRNELKKLYFRGGCKNPAEFLYRKEVESWSKLKNLDICLTVDKDIKGSKWKGNVGLVTSILDDLDVDLKNSFVVVCGPPMMMKFTTLKLLEMGFKDKQIYLSMEKNMSCAIGKCGHCRIGTYYACKDGPVFRYDMIKNFHNIWD